MSMGKCPACGVDGIAFCKGHKIKTKGGWNENYVQDICFRCGYESEKYPARPMFVINGRDYQQRALQKVVRTEEKKITFTASRGDVEFTIKVGKDGLSKLFSVFTE